MAIVIDGTGSITGLSAGGLPDGSITADDLASGAVTTAKLADGAVTADKLATAVIPLGVGQSWSSVIGSKSKRTTYQNTTGRPIFISISFVAPFTSTLEIWGHTTSDVFGSGIIIVRADGGDYYSASAYTNHPANIQAIIPNGYYYNVWDPGNDVTIALWTELS